MNEPNACGLCDGTGECDYGEGDETCRTCNGTGLVWPSVPNEVVVMPGGPSGRLPGDLGLIVPVPGHRIIVQPLEGGS
ncbi:MAG: hypothetical protein ABFE13_11465 [Phycisphaerales bacterium]